MKKFLLSPKGKFYKANLHCHSTVSDGTFTPEELKDMYMENGYSVIAYTDHDVLIPHQELTDENFLALNGYEMEINSWSHPEFECQKAFHMCLIALDPDNITTHCWHRSEYVFGNAVNYRDKVKINESEPDYIRKYTPECINDMFKIGRDNGFFVTYNHPGWSIEDYSDYSRYENMHAMEIYNHECGGSGINDYNEKVYDDMLRCGKRIFCIATDDNHKDVKHRFFGGFTMIKAEKLEYKAITDALIAGDFYASQGPEIYDLWFEDGKIHITCSDAECIALRTATRRAATVYADDDKPVTEAAFDVFGRDGYVRIVVTDSKGKCAYTNAYFVDELF